MRSGLPQLVAGHLWRIKATGSAGGNLLIGNWKMAASNIVVSIDEYMGITAGIISAYHLIKSSNLSSS